MQYAAWPLILLSSRLVLAIAAVAELKYLHQPDSYSLSPVQVQKITCFVNYMTTMETWEQLHGMLHISLVKRLSVTVGGLRTARNLGSSNCVSFFPEKLV